MTADLYTPPVRWPKEGESILYRKVLTRDYVVGMVVTSPQETDSLSLLNGVWEILTKQGSLILRKGYELRAI